MKIYGQCRGCYKNKLFIRKRAYKHPAINDTITSNNLLCGKCYRAINQMINP